MASYDPPTDFLSMKMAEKTKTTICKEIFDDFQRFLRTENKTIDGMTKTEVKEWYGKQYRVYRKQISPEQPLPTFYKLFRVLFQQSVAHFENERICLGPLDGKQVKRTRNKPRGRASGDDFNTTSSPYTGNTSGNHMTTGLINRSRMAVDQHLTFKTGSVKIVDLPDFKGDLELWKHVTKTKSQSTNIYYCAVCQSKCNSLVDMDQHVKGRRHRLANSMSVLKSKKKDLVKGVPEIVISSSSTEVNEDGVFFIQLKENEPMITDIVLTNRSDITMELAHCEMMKKCRVFTLNDSKKVTDGMGSVSLAPGEKYTITVRTKPQHVGSYHCPVIFHVISHRPNTRQTGYILRYLHCKCRNSITDDLQPTSPYKKPPRTNRKRGQMLEIVPGYKLPRFSGDSLEREIELGTYSVPSDVRKMINRGVTDKTSLTEEEQLNMEKLKCVLEGELDMNHYQERFKSLLFFEEVQMEVDIRRYDMEDVVLKTYPKNHRLLLLQVPGLSENRPSVLRGDWLYVCPQDSDGQPGKREYQGFVHDVFLDEVALGFNESFRESFIEKQSFNVRFVFNRLPTRLQHRACQLADELSLGPILFPTEDSLLTTQPTLPDLKLYNTDLEKNTQQMCAVQHIVAGTSKPAPYLVFGPPGTGKTVTIVEAIKQVLKCSPDSHILACTPSNSAADLIAKRLIKHVGKCYILRLNAASRSITAIPEEIREVCNYDNQSCHFQYRSKNIISEYRIVITTLVTAGRLVSANFPPGHFSHIFIDEAGHAPEPEALISIAGIMEVNPALKTGGQVVIAGDPKQLGPILRSPLAIKYGLDMSLLERYMESCHLYQPLSNQDGHKSYDVRVITKLLKNYRSHPTILELPNQLFYDSELEPCASIDREKLCKWEGLPKKDFPVLFHGVIGEDMREERSPSFFNPQEVAIVTQYVEQLMTCRKGGIRLHEADIGVISPYRKQVQKIKRVLKNKKYEKISVGSVEEFQGQERTVIIVSTVRSNHEYLSLDMQFKLGFLRNPKRFNVTVTRAKALLIVIGNPNTLSGDEHWKQLIEYCDDHGSYRGAERMSEDDEVEDLIQRLRAIELIDDEYRLNPLIPEQQSDYNEQAWRSEL